MQIDTYSHKWYIYTNRSKNNLKYNIMKHLKPILPKLTKTYGSTITLAFSKKGEAFVSEKNSGQLWQIDHENYRLITVLPVPPLFDNSEGGFMGVALDPDFQKNGFLYCYHLYKKKDHLINRVIRIKKDGSGKKVILDDIPGSQFENGGIMAFGLDKKLYIGTGHINKPELSQDLKSLAGKILRINTDGSIPKDNPFPDSPIYSYGHRNIFGLAFHPKTGNLYISETGPTKNDRIIIVQKGINYGWSSPGKVLTGKEIGKPIKIYKDTITPTQNVFVKEHLYFGSYNEGTVHKLTLSGKDFDHVEKDEIVFTSTPWTTVGVFYGSDNKFYVLGSNSITRFSPKVKKLKTRPKS